MNIHRKSKSKNVRSITVGDVALIRDDDPVPREWRMGRILRLVKGPDGQVRVPQLAVLSNLGKRTTVFRPLQKLIPFEIEENYADNESGAEGTADESQLDEFVREHECNEDESTNEEHTDVNEDNGVERDARERRPLKAKSYADFVNSVCNVH